MVQVESVERERTRPHVEFCLVDDSVDCSGAPPPPPTSPLCDTELSHSIAASQQQQQQQQQQQRGLQRRDTPHHLKNKRVNTPPLPPAAGAGASAADSAAAGVADTDPAQADRVRRLLARQIIGKLCTTAEEMTGAADSSPAAGLLDDATEVCRPHPTAPRHILPQISK